MPARSLILTGPVFAAGPVSNEHLGTLVTADVLVRAGAAGGVEVDWAALVLPGGQAATQAAGQALVRAGQDRLSVGREAFAERVRSVEEDGRNALATTAAALGLGLDVEGAVAAAGHAAVVARTAFVHLFDRGLLTEEDRVVHLCPGCRTVVSAADTEPARLPGEDLVLRLNLVVGGVGAVEVRTSAPELLPGVVAVAVPEDHPAAGRAVVVPISAMAVPVVVDAAAAEPVLVVPAHDARALELARRHGLAAVPVLDGEAVVRAPGPLFGLARHGARALARRLLDAEGALRYALPCDEPVATCGCCRTVLVPVLGRHWFLELAELEGAAADAVRDGRLALSPPAAREVVLAQAGAAPPWPVTHQLWCGVPVPVARCRECGQVDVAGEGAGSCGKCMGELVPDDGVLDARFVACAWALARTGWPGPLPAPPSAAPCTLVVAPRDLVRLVLPMAGLALRLAGEVPFAEVVTAPPGDPSAPAADGPPLDVPAAVAEHGRPAVRLALVRGTASPTDLPAAEGMAARLDRPIPGAGDLDRLSQLWSAAMAAGAPATALDALLSAVDGGLPAASIARVAALVAPFTGD